MREGERAVSFPLAMHRLIAAVLAVILSGSCVTSSSSPRYARHFDRAMWIDGFRAQFEDPWQYTPEIVALGVLPVAAYINGDLHDEATDHQSVSNGDYTSGDAISLGLGALTLAWGGVEWSRGDQGRRLEVAVESLTATFAVTHVVKLATSIDRPHSATGDSFPSGHTSLAFCGATFFARSVEAETNSKLGYLMFLPAAYVGIDRVEVGRHWATDVAAGALVGAVLTDWVWNAHYGTRDASGIFGPQTHGASWRPSLTITDGKLALALNVSF